MPDGPGNAHPELLLLSVGRGGWRTLVHIIATWDMLNADVPDRSQLERCTATLLGSGLIQADDRGRLRTTRTGVKLLKSPSLRHVRPGQQVSELGVLLEGILRSPADYEIPEPRYRSAVDEYLSGWR